MTPSNKVIAQTTVPRIYTVETAEPALDVPHGQPVAVSLYNNIEFADYKPKTFSYSPPATMGPWSKVVLVARFKCTAGRQFDRTCTVFIGGVNVYFGTTAEPSDRLAPQWHIQRDITSYSAVLAGPHSGSVSLGNIVDSRYTGVLSGSAELDFYPKSEKSIVAQAPDEVLGLNDQNTCDALTSSSDTLSKSFTLPRNITSAYLDVITESQAADEFWYTNVPDNDAAALSSDGGTAFREAEIAIDSVPAGVAPIYPYIYTGGISPALWTPIPGIQTLSFTPYRVNLTPFAGTLDDGNQHTISVRVYGARDNFSTCACLLLYQDRRAKIINGATTINTLTNTPRPGVLSLLQAPLKGEHPLPVSVSSNRTFVICGYVVSRGIKTVTKLQESCSFQNNQWNINVGNDQKQIIEQTTVTATTTNTWTGSILTEKRAVQRYGLYLHWDSLAGTSEQSTQNLDLDQTDAESLEYYATGKRAHYFRMLNEVKPEVTELAASDGHILKVLASNSSQKYVRLDSSGTRYSNKIKSVGDKLMVGD